MTANSSVDAVVRSFAGTFPCRLDEKGRMSILKPFLDVYAERNKLTPPLLILSAGEQHGALVMNIFDPLYIASHERELGEHYRCTVDEQKRILVPRPLIDYANLKKDVVISATKTGDYLYVHNATEMQHAEILAKKVKPK